MIQYGHSSQRPRAGACLRVSEVEAHSPAGLNLLSVTAGLLTYPRPLRAFSERFVPFGILSQWLSAADNVWGTYSSGYCSGLTPDSLLKLLERGIAAFRPLLPRPASRSRPTELPSHPRI